MKHYIVKDPAGLTINRQLVAAGQPLPGGVADGQIAAFKYFGQIEEVDEESTAKGAKNAKKEGGEK